MWVTDNALEKFQLILITLVISSKRTVIVSDARVTIFNSDNVIRTISKLVHLQIKCVSDKKAIWKTAGDIRFQKPFQTTLLQQRWFWD